MAVGSIPLAGFFENAFYVGMHVEDILYGVILVLYLKTMRIFLGRRREPYKSDVFFAVFSSVTFLLITGWIATEAIFGEKMWLLDRNYPGGPLAYLLGPASHWYSVTVYQAAATIVLQQMTDGLMMYRCQIVWDSFYAIILPSILWLATLVLGILAAATQDTDPNVGISLLFTFIYYATSVFLCATLTCMICYRLWRHARAVKECLGPEFATPYFTTAMLLVESVLPYTLSGIVFLVAYAIGSPVVITCSRVYTLMMCLSPQMLILRVAEGNAWQKDTIKSSTSVIRFSVGRGTTSDLSRFGEGRVTVMHLETSRSMYHPEAVVHSDKV